MSLFQWPFKRKHYAGLGNPRFVDDIVAANEAVIDGLKAITGLSNTDFAIISGLDYTAGSPSGTYAPGIFYLNGSFYFIGTGFSEGLYVAPNPTDTMSQPFSDGNSRNIYQLLYGQSTSSPTGASPVFSGDMNSYRLGLKNIKAQVLVLAALYNGLGNSAVLNVGTTPGTVAAGDDPRFGYTKAQIDSLFALQSSVILKGAGTSYTPSASTDPVNKQYADQAAGCRLRYLGNFAGDGSSVTPLGPSSSPLTVTYVRLGTGHYRITHNLGSTSYFISCMGIDPVAQTVSVRSWTNITTTTFEIYNSNDSSLDDGSFQIAIFQYF
jgi:hypothetical protein